MNELPDISNNADSVKLFLSTLLAVRGPTPGCVISRSTSGRFLASCSTAAVNSGIAGFIRSSSSKSTSTPQVLDSPTLAFISTLRRKVGGRRSVAENPAVGARKQGQNPKHHERLVLPCHPMGLGREKSNHERTSEREAHQDPGCSHTRGDRSIAFQAARTSAHSRGIGCVHRTTARRTHRTTVAGHRFRKTCNPCSPLRGHDGRGNTKDRGIGQGRAARLSTCRVSEEIQRHQRIQPTNKLGVRVSSDDPWWPETLWRRYGKPAVESAKISKRVGFHTFRHYAEFRTMPHKLGLSARTTPKISVPVI